MKSKQQIRTYISGKELLLLAILAIAIFSFYLWLPVTLIPGNSLEFYLSIRPWWSFVLMGMLALEVSFVLIKRLSFAWQKRAVNINKGILPDTMLAIGSILPSVLTCPILAITVFSFFLPLAAIYNLVGSKENITILAVIVMSLVVAYRLKTMEIKQKQNR